jgi:geranylgeranyl pyrophosphate synthase
LIADYSFFPLLQANILELEILIKQQANGYHQDINSALEILMKSGGKRIRPMITLLVGHMLNSPTSQIINLAASIELLHTATLVHDDLIDGAMLRRGTPTLNSKWSASATVLTGDFLFASAAKLAADTNSIAVMKLFAKTLMVIVNGEITQQLSSNWEFNRENYYGRIYSKTASLFETAAASAALLSPHNNNYLDDIKSFGQDIGIAFQIIDDILDFTGDPTTLGKPVGSDLRQGIVTLPAIYYSEMNPDDSVINAFKNNQFTNAELEIEKLINAIRSSGAIEKSKHEATLNLKSGIMKLHNLPPSDFRDALEEVAQTIVERNL